MLWNMLFSQFPLATKRISNLALVLFPTYIYIHHIYLFIHVYIYIYGTPPQKKKRSTCFCFLLVFTWFYSKFAHSSKIWLLKKGIYIYLYIYIASPPKPTFCLEPSPSLPKKRFPYMYHFSCFHCEKASTLPKKHCPYNLLFISRKPGL